MTDHIWTAKDTGNLHACGCIGPQNGDPLCPCMMRGVTIRDGRYVQVTDLGPAPTPSRPPLHRKQR